MKIKIGIWTYSKIYSVYADDSTQDFSIGVQKLPFSQDFLTSAINVVKDWPDHIEDTNMRDGIIYKVTYNDGSVERTVTGNNKTPDNFNGLMRLVEKYTPKTKEEQIRESFLKSWLGIE